MFRIVGVLFLVSCFFQSTFGFAEHATRTRTRVIAQESPSGEPVETTEINRTDVKTDAKSDSPALSTRAAAAFPLGIVTESSWWRPERYHYVVGYDGVASGTSLLGQNAVVFGMWLNRDIGFEGFLGLSKTGNTLKTTTNSQSDIVGKTAQTTVQTTGANNPTNWVIGGVAKYRFYQSSWFQFYGGALLAVLPGSTVDYAVGTTVTSTPNTDASTTYVTTETGVGDRSDATSWAVAVGPKLGSEFYLKWFPHLAIGFSTGILTTFGGDTTSTETTRSRTISTVSGLPQTPTASSTDTQTIKTQKGTQANTFGIGGTTFSFTGVFSLRYVW